MEGKNMRPLLRQLVFVCFFAPTFSHAQKAEMPAISAFIAGDTWEWRQVDNRTKMEEKRRTRTTVDVNGKPLFRHSEEVGDSEISLSLLGTPASMSRIAWPLEVGKKWVFNGNWIRVDGVSGNTKQDAVVTAFEEITVPAGKFMAYKIEYRGWYQTSRPGSGKQNDTFWYAPEVFAEVKHIRDDGFNQYTRELLSYKHDTR